jgi:large subunit ribosomal protein L13
VVIIDGKGLIFGRLASEVAKRLLQGESVNIINAEQTIISGKRLSIIKKKQDFLQIGHPGKGPFHQRRPDSILRRSIRGMLPWKKAKGKNAYRKLKVFIGFPRELQGDEPLTINRAKADKLTCPYITLAELANEIGWQKQER